MRITHLSTTDQAGGAARAAYRLHQGLLELGCESRMLVQSKLSADPTVIPFVPPQNWSARARRAIRGRYLSRNRRRLEALPKGASFLSEDRSEYGADLLQQLSDPQILNLHWVAGLFDYQEFFRCVPPNLPIVWTLHDMNPFTGGCHFDDGCGKFVAECGACPQLGSSRSNDFSAKCWHRKKSALESVTQKRLHLVTPSHWMAGEARKSSLLGRYPVSVIPNSLDTEIFKPHDKKRARQLFGIPPEGKVVLFVADSVEEKRKGIHKLLQAVGGLDAGSDVFLLSLGRGVETPGSNIPIRNLGYIREDDRLSLVYSAADIFVAPSLQDNLPNTILEALACGIPVIAFSVGGCVELVREGETGMLVKAGDHEQLREAIAGLLGASQLRATMSQACRRTAVEGYGLKIQAARYKHLYDSLLQN